jgi:glutathionylspermidine synthase
MRREVLAPRAQLESRLRELNMWPADGQPYYDESAAYVFTEAQVETLYEATAELERMVGVAVDHVIAKNRFDELGIPKNLAKYAAETRKRGDPSVYGRMDLVYDGINPPKLLEYNADTPTALFEAAVLQWEWLKATHPNDDQFNSIHEALVAQWAKLKAASNRNRLTLIGMLEEDDDRATIAYMEDVAHQAGWVTVPTEIADLGHDANGIKGGGFVDADGVYVQAMFKLYPWDWMAREDFFDKLVKLDVPVMETPWRVIAASKGILPILWELFPDHPNLLPASFNDHPDQGPRVSKPMFGREGSDVAFHDVAGAPLPIEGGYADQKRISQAYCPLPVFDGWHTVIGSWVIGGEPCGIGVREDRGMVTGTGAKFRPHRMMG